MSEYRIPTTPLGVLQAIYRAIILQLDPDATFRVLMDDEPTPGSDDD